MKSLLPLRFISIAFLFEIYSLDVFAYTNYVVPNDVIPVNQLLKCDEFNWYEKAICEDVAAQISQVLKEQNIIITNNEAIQYISPIASPRKVDTGHSCSHRAWLRNNNASISLSTDSSLDLDGDLISEPLNLAANLPVSLYLKANFKEEWGYKYYTIKCRGLKCKKKKKCGHLASDHYYADLDVNTNAKFLISVNMQPRYGRTADGNYFITVKPIATVNFSLDDYNTDFNLHGKNSLLSAYGSILTSVSSASKLFAAWLSGSATADIRDQLYFDIGYGLVSRLDLSYSRGAFESQGALFEKLVNEEIEKRAPYGIEDVDRRLENKLTNSISSALNLDENGERVWIVDKNRPLEKLASMLVIINSIIL